jgi:hypothetical protein
VQIVERLHHARRVEPSGGVVEVSLVPQDGPQLAPQTTLHQHVQIFAVLKRLEQFNDEVAIGLAHDLLLGHDVLLLARLHDLRLLHLLQGEGTFRRVALDLDELDAPEPAHAQRRQLLQIGEGDSFEFLVHSGSGSES